MKKNLFLLIFIILAVVYGPILLSFNRFAPDFPTASKSVVDAGFQLPQSWSVRTSAAWGENVLFTLWSWPMDVVFGLGSSVGIGFPLLMRLVLILPMLVLGSYSIYSLLRYFEIKDLYSLIGVVIYLLNTYILSLIDGGQLSVALAYATLPVVFLIFEKFYRKSLLHKLFVSLGVTAYGFIDIRYFYILFILLGLRLLYLLLVLGKQRAATVKHFVVTLFLSGLLYLLFNLYWIIPLLIYSSQSIPAEIVSASQLAFLNFTTLSHAIFLYQPHWPSNIFGVVTLPLWEFLFIPVLALIAVIFSKERKNLVFFTLLFAISVFLTKGSNPPGEGVYSLLYSKIPGFVMFRDSTKFFVLVALSITFLISKALQIGEDRFPRLKYLFIASFLVYLMIIIRPIWLNQMTGFFSSPLNEKLYDQVAKNLKSDNIFGRILWLPYRPSLGYSSLNHPVAEGLQIGQIRPFAGLNVGSYERYNFLRESSAAGQLLETAGISYLGFSALDPRRDNPSEDEIQSYHTFVNLLSHKEWVDQVISPYPLTTIRLKTEADFIYTSSILWWHIGNERFLNEASTIENFRLKDNPVVFVEQEKGLLNKYKANPIGKIIVYYKQREDIVGAFLNKERYVKLPDMGNSGEVWSTDINNLSMWRNFLQEKYKLDNLDFDFDSKTIVVEGNKEISIPIDSSGKKYVFVRALVSPQGGNLTFNFGKDSTFIETKQQNSQKYIQKITTIPEDKSTYSEYDLANFAWVRLGEFDLGKTLQITSQGGLNAINAIASVDEEEIKEMDDYVASLESEGKIVYWNILDSTEKELLFTHSTERSTTTTWERVSPTKYLITNELSQQRVLVLSQAYDSLWKFNGESSVPLFGFLNGFLIKEGVTQGTIVYEPQLLVEKLFLISLASVTLIFGAILYALGKRKIHNI